jgi:hypothetical protein
VLPTRMTSRQPIGSIASLNASLTIAIFDARAATEWIPTKPAATKAQFTGHPAEIMRGLGKGEDVTAIDVGASSGFAFELEGKSGRIDAYRLDDGTLALVAPLPSSQVSTFAQRSNAPDPSASCCWSMRPRLGVARVG